MAWQAYAAPIDCRRRTHFDYIRYLDDFPSFPLTTSVDDTQCGIRDRQGLCRPDKHEGRRTLHPHDHRSRRPGPRPHMRQRHDRLRRRAMGPALDHHRHQPRRPGAGPHPLDGREISRTICSPTRPRASRRKPSSPGKMPPTTRPRATSARDSSTSAFRTSRSNRSPTIPTSRKG